MRLKTIIILFFISLQLGLFAQSINVRADYTSFGDVEFVAYNNTNAPLFLYLNFDNLENTSFQYPLPYIKRLSPGFNNLFILERYLDSEHPRFNYSIDQYISNPIAEIELEFPYILPFESGSVVKSIDIDNLNISNKQYYKDFYATAFLSKSQKIVASRNGVVVDIKESSIMPKRIYPGWQHSITVLQPDGTLMTYQNIIANRKIKVGKKIYAGKIIGKLSHPDLPLIQFISQSEIDTHELRPIIPKYLVDKTTVKLMIGEEEYTVIHPKAILGREMTRKEKRKYLK